MASSRSAVQESFWTRAIAKLKFEFLSDKYQKEAIFLLIIGMSLFYVLAVQDYHPKDPSPFVFSYPPKDVTNICGWFGAFLAGLGHFLFGVGAYLVPLPFLFMGYTLVRNQPFAFSKARVFGWMLLFTATLIFIHFLQPKMSILTFKVPTGGAVGEYLANLFAKAFGTVGAYVCLATMTFCSLHLITRKAWLSSSVLRLKEMKLPHIKIKKSMTTAKTSLVAEPSKPVVHEPARIAEAAPPSPPEPVEFIEKPVNPELEFYDEYIEQEPVAKTETKEKVDYTPPSTTIFRSSPALGPLKDEQKREYEQTASDLTKAFEDFSISGNVVAIQPGPVVTVYEFRPDAGIKISKIMGLIDDIALALKVDSVLMNPVCGKSAIGVQVPNKSRETVYLGDVVNAAEFKNSSSPMTLAMGKSLSGEPVCSDLTTMPHLLAAGATGSGKSVAVNALLCSVILKSSPEEVRMILVDPKMLELSVYEGIPHLLLPVITDAKKASSALRWACHEMERRYRLMQLAKVRHIRGFNQFWEKASADEKYRIREQMEDDSIDNMPYLLLVIDELADLMLTAPKDVETSIQRLAQKARASGIHLVLATQRPSVDIITGVIKANLPCRISFQTVSKHDSRTILDQVGSEKLLGKGDMLFQRPGTSRLERIQGAFIEDDEVISLVDSIKSDGEETYDPEVIDWIDKEFERSYEESSVAGSEECDDPKFDMAIDIAARQGYVSASFLQRQLKIGYNRAARMVEAMEAQGMVGPADGSKPRKWLGRQEEEV